MDFHFFFGLLHNKFKPLIRSQPSSKSVRGVSAYWQDRPVDLIDGSFPISVKDFETLSGKKMKLIEKISFKLGQQKLRRSINNDGSFSQKRFEKYFGKFWGVGGFSLVGLLLGLFLSLIGVLIAYLIWNDKSRIRWAWIGAIISLIVWGAILI